MDVVIRQKAGRVAAGGRGTLPVEVRMRAVPVLTARQRERVEGALTAAIFAALIALCGALEASTWPM